MVAGTSTALRVCPADECPRAAVTHVNGPPDTRSRSRLSQVGTQQSVLQLLAAGQQACLPAVAFASEQCPLQPVLVPADGVIKEVVPQALVLTFTLINCNADNITAAGVSYVLLNPGGQNLSTTQAPLPWTYIAFAACWVLLLLTDAIHIRRRGGLTVLQAALLAVPVLKVVNMAIAAAKWASLNHSGLESPQLNVGDDIMSTCSQVTLLGVILLLSRGWLVTRAALGAPERNSLMLSLALLAALYFVYFLYSPRSFFALALAYVAVLGFALTSVSQGLRHLRAQAQLLRVSSAADELQASFAWARVSMFSRFHVALFVFTCAEVVLHLVALFVASKSWLNNLFSELADLAMAVAVGLLFRARMPSPFVGDDTMEVLAAAAGSVIAGTRRGALLFGLGQSAEASGLGGGGAIDEELQAAIGIDMAPSRSVMDAGHRASGGAGAMSGQSLPVLVENPCSFDMHGRPVVSVSVGVLHPPSPKPSEEESPADGATPRLHFLSPSVELSTMRMTPNPLWERRQTETQPQERDSGLTGPWAGPVHNSAAGQPQQPHAPLSPQQVLQLQQQAAADRFRAMWGAPGFTQRDQNRPPPQQQQQHGDDDETRDEAEQL